MTCAPYARHRGRGTREAEQALLGVVAAGPRRPTARLIADRIVTAIALGEFVPGQKLPAERDLAAATRREPHDGARRSRPRHLARPARGAARTDRRRVRAVETGARPRRTRCARSSSRSGPRSSRRWTCATSSRPSSRARRRNDEPRPTAAPSRRASCLRARRRSRGRARGGHPPPPRRRARDPQRRTARSARAVACAGQSGLRGRTVHARDLRRGVAATSGAGEAVVAGDEEVAWRIGDCTSPSPTTRCAPRSSEPWRLPGDAPPCLCARPCTLYGLRLNQVEEMSRPVTDEVVDRASPREDEYAWTFGGAAPRRVSARHGARGLHRGLLRRSGAVEGPPGQRGLRVPVPEPADRAVLRRGRRGR